MNNTGLLNNQSAVIISNSSNTLIGIVLSPLGLVTNFLIILTIGHSKKLHNKSQFVIVSNSAAEFARMFTYLVDLWRYIPNILGEPDIHTAFECASRAMFYHFVVDIYHKRMYLWLAFDRFLCISAPVYYRNMNGVRYIAQFNIACVAYALIRSAFLLLLTYGKQTIVACNVMFACNHTAIIWNEIENAIVIVLTVACYVATCYLLYHRYKSENLIGEAAKSEWRKRMDFDVFTAASVIGLIYFIGMAVPFFMGITITWLTGREESRAFRAFAESAYYVFIGLNVFNSVSHLFVYLKMNAMFRKSFWTLFCECKWKKNRVQGG